MGIQGKSVGRLDIAAAIKRDVGITESEARRLVGEMLDMIADELVTTSAVKIKNFGIFESRLTPGRYGRNPRRPEELYMVPAHRRLAFRPSAELIQKMNPDSDIPTYRSRAGRR